MALNVQLQITKVSKSHMWMRCLGTYYRGEVMTTKCKTFDNNFASNNYK